MTVTTSRWPAVVDALLATFGTVEDVTTFDGPEFMLTADDGGNYVIVGGADDAETEAGGIGQTWGAIGAKRRDEAGQVTCAVVVQTGDPTIKPSRDRAFVVLASLEQALVADPTLGGAVDAGWLLPLTGSVSQWQNELGSFCRLAFAVTYKARL